MRAKLSEKKSNEIMETKDIHFKIFDKGLKSKRYGINNLFLASIFSGTCYINKLNMLQTCNMAFYRNDAIKINGFNEDFIGWGREDSEFGARMLNSEITRRDLRFAAVAYHIHHEGNSRKMLDHNHKIYLNTLEKKLVFQKIHIIIQKILWVFQEIPLFFKKILLIFQKKLWSFKIFFVFQV